MTEKLKVYISRRDFLKLASLGTLGAVVASCGPRVTLTPVDSGSEPQPTDELAPTNPDAVQWWVGWGELVPIFASFKEMAKYKELMGSIDVEMKPSVANEALFTSLAAGTPPDAASNVPYSDLFTRDVCIDISDWVSKSSIIKKEDYIGGNWDAGFYNGKQYGVPWDMGMVGFWYNNRKVCFGTRSEKGFKSHSIIPSLVQTAKRQGVHPLTFLKTLLTAEAATAQAALYNDSS